MFAGDTLITSASDMTNWQNVIVAIITACSLVAVAYLQFVYRAGKKRGKDAVEANEMFMNQWVQNKEDHNFVVEQISTLGKTLGRSIDKTNNSLDRVETKLDTHIRDHAVGEFDIDDIRFKTGEKAKEK